MNKTENKIAKSVGKDREDKARELGRIERRLTLAMQKFITPTATILEKYPNWTADTLNFQPVIK